VRRTIFIGLLSATLLVSAPAARATDDSVRAVVKTQADRQIKQDKKFEKALKKLKTKAQLKKARTATKTQRASIETFKQALAAERADSAKVKKGRREMLDALNLYDRGLNKLHTALTQAINAGGASGEAKARSAIKNMATAVRRVYKAAKKIG
jgi:type I site-specific restriction-modification system R (restriction) subunit